MAKPTSEELRERYFFDMQSRFRDLPPRTFTGTAAHAVDRVRTLAFQFADAVKDSVDGPDLDNALAAIDTAMVGTLRAMYANP